MFLAPRVLLFPVFWNAPPTIVRRETNGHGTVATIDTAVFFSQSRLQFTLACCLKSSRNIPVRGSVLLYCSAATISSRLIYIP